MSKHSGKDAGLLRPPRFLLSLNLLPETHSIRVGRVVSLDETFFRKDSAYEFIGCEKQLLACDELREAVLLQLNRYSEDVLFN